MLIEMLIRSAELTHASEKFDFATKKCGTGRGLRGGYHFVGCATVANQLAAAWMWLAGALPLSLAHSNSLLYFLLFCETHDLVREIVIVSEKRMKNCILKIIDSVFEKNDEGGLFSLITQTLFCMIYHKVGLLCSKFGVLASIPLFSKSLPIFYNSVPDNYWVMNL